MTTELQEALEYYTPEKTAQKHEHGQAIIKAAQSYAALLPLLEKVDITVLQAALKNAVRPTDETAERGEYALWCGPEHHAQVILDAANTITEIQKIIGGGDEN